MDHQTLRQYITPFLNLSDEDIYLLMDCVQDRKLKKGEIVLKEGDVCRSFYLVEKGYLRTWYDKDGAAINLNFTFEGEFTTNFKSFRNREPSELSIEAGENADVWIFNLTSLWEQFGTRPEIMRFLRRVAFSLLLDAEKHSDLFKIYTPTERYRYIEKNNPRLLQRISLSQLASYLGVTRETLSRIRGKNN